MSIYRYKIVTKARKKNKKQILLIKIDISIQFLELNEKNKIKTKTIERRYLSHTETVINIGIRIENVPQVMPTVEAFARRYFLQQRKKVLGEGSEILL